MPDATPSLCDTCRAPGKCCSGFVLNGGAFAMGDTMLEALAKLASLNTGLIGRDGKAGPVANPGDYLGATHVQLGAPFMPLYADAQGRWRFWCPLLGRDGRCTDYEHRPAVCRGYVAGKDALCAMHEPKVEEAADA
jgi:Fe-S-cluster containining protein